MWKGRNGCVRESAEGGERRGKECGVGGGAHLEVVRAHSDVQVAHSLGVDVEQHRHCREGEGGGHTPPTQHDDTPQHNIRSRLPVCTPLCALDLPTPPLHTPTYLLPPPPLHPTPPHHTHAWDKLSFSCHILSPAMTIPYNYNPRPLPLHLKHPPLSPPFPPHLPSSSTISPSVVGTSWVDSTRMVWGEGNGGIGLRV